MSQWLRTFTVLPEDWGLIISSQAWVTPVPEGIQLPPLTFEGTRHANGTHTYMKTKHTNK